MRSTGRMLLGSLVTSGGVQGLNALTGVILARGLGPGGRGEVAVIILWPSLLVTVGSLGVVQAATYQAARAEWRLGTLVGSTLMLGLVQSVVFVGVGLILLPLVLHGYDSDVVHTAYVFLLYIPLNLFQLLLMAILNGLHKFAAFNVLRMIGYVTTASLLVVYAVLGTLTVPFAASAYGAASLATAAAGAILLARTRPGRLSLDRALTRKLLSFGVKTHTANMSQYLNERLDQLVISVFLNPVKLGLYVVAVTLGALTTLIGQSAAYVALPVIARLDPGEDRNAAARFFVGMTLVAATAVTLPILAFTPMIIDVFFGSAFADAADPSRILLLAAIVISMNAVLTAVVQAVGRPLDAGIAQGAALAGTIGGLAVLLPALGLIGAAVASLLAYGVAAAFLVHRAMRALEVPVGKVLIPDRATLVEFRSMAKDWRQVVKGGALRRRGR